MKKIINIFLILVFSIQLTNTTQAQDVRTLNTKVVDVLAQLPANDLAFRDKLLKEFITYGDEGFQLLAKMLVAPGTGNDASVRMLINSLARYAGEKPDSPEREFVEKNLLNSIENENDAQIQTFLIRQLNLAGTNKSIDLLKTFLQNTQLCEPATQALVAIHTPEAATAVYEKLKGAEGRNQVTLVKALGDLQCKKALPEIMALEKTDNLNLRKVVLFSLSNIGTPEPNKILRNAAEAVNYGFDPTHATESLLNYADRLGSQEEFKLCKKVLKNIMASCKTTELLHNNSAALSIYAKYFGDEVHPLLQKAVQNPSKPYRYAILRIAAGSPGLDKTYDWIKIAGKSEPDIRGDIIYMLGLRQDPVAIPFVKKSLNSPEAYVRESAIEALPKLKTLEVVQVLLDHLSTGKDVYLTKKIILQNINNSQLDKVVETMNKSEGDAKAACLSILSARAGTKYFGEVYRECNAQDENVKSAAYIALKGVSTDENVGALISLLLSTQEPSYIPNVQAAIIRSLSGSKRQEEGTELLISTLDKTDKKERIIEILPHLGGADALATVTKYFSSTDPSVKEVSFNALVNWEDASATASLYHICQHGPKEYQSKAFRGFVNQVNHSDMPADQRLLMARKIMPYATGTEEQKMVLKSLGNNRTFLTLIYLSNFLDQQELQQEAATSLMKIALPSSGEKTGMSGEIVRGLLTKVSGILNGPESDYERENIRSYLEKMPAEKGFVSMFNGTDLTGWKGFVADPVKLAKMSSKELEKKQKEANIKMFDNWSVRDGMIVFNGKGANLVSDKHYGDFEMIVDWKITKNGDSGIYLRGTPQVQIWDTSRRNVGAQVGSGGLYNNQKYPSKPLKVADNPIGEWNTFHIMMQGENVTVYLNGELVVDNVPMENYWSREDPIFPTGTIELQAHGSDLAFRDIYIREIKEQEYNLTPEEKAMGFVALFNGKNLNGWVGNKVDYVVENGNIVIRPKEGSHGNLFTEKEYGDFVFRFEFLLTPGANNGLGIRAPLEGDAAYVGMEIQILDNTAPVYANLHAYQYHGSVYGVIPAKRGYLKPVGEWNSEEVRIKASKITVTLNGTVILDGDIKEASKNGTLDHKNHPGLQRKKGHIGFLGHGSVVTFRNIRIKEL